MFGAKALHEPVLVDCQLDRHEQMWNVYQTTTLLYKENAFENVVSKMVAILSRPQYQGISGVIAKTVQIHYNDVRMTTMASQITSLVVGYSAVFSGADQRKHQSSASLAFVDRWIPRTNGQ